MRHAFTLVIASATLLASSVVQAQATRDYVSIVGSSTVYPFATVVAERFGRTSDYKTPKVESTGSGGGFKLFCAGVGVDSPDITNASRRIKPSEVERCAGNGVTDIVEVKIGYDGIAVANATSGPRLSLTRKDLYLALARDVPDPSGAPRLVANPYTNWKQVDPSLPDESIEVLGPPPTSGTRDAFVELVMDEGCREWPFIAAMDKPTRKAACRTLREDGGYIEAGENDNLIVQKLVANPVALGIFGFSYLDQNTDRIQGATIDAVAPTFDNIADGSYPISRPLYFYVKKAHVGRIPGLAEYIAEFTSEKTWGNDGYLADRGLIPMPDAERLRFNADASSLVPLKLAGN